VWKRYDELTTVKGRVAGLGGSDEEGERITQNEKTTGSLTGLGWRITSLDKMSILCLVTSSIVKAMQAVLSKRFTAERFPNCSS
jgi:hypothetical protein